jgi:hypothetical protein
VFPPVMVRSDSVTVGVAVVDPIVITGPPPEILVAAAPTPIRLTLRSIVTPPANLPDPILIVSPSLAAFTAAWIVAKQCGPPTQSVFASTPAPEGCAWAVAGTSAVRLVRSTSERILSWFDTTAPCRSVVTRRIVLPVDGKKLATEVLVVV